MPFITEDIWQHLPREHEVESIMVSKWPHMQKPFISKEVDSKMGLLIKIIQAVRNLRATWHIDHTKEIEILIKTSKKDVISNLNDNSMYVKRLTRVNKLEVSKGVNLV